MVGKPQATEDSISMCPDHAEAFKAPVGWVFTDQRTAEDEVLEEAERADASLNRLPAYSAAEDEVLEVLEEVELVDEPVLASVELLYPENDATGDEGETSVVSSESNDEHPEIDRTPLLARAFRNSQSLLNE